MKIAIIGSGNVGGALAKKWIQAGHKVLIGARFPLSDKNLQLAAEIGKDPFTSIESAVTQSEIILISIPATATVEVVKSLGNTAGKIIIDTMNVVMGRGPEGYKNTTDAILGNTQTRDVVKCFNTTGFNCTFKINQYINAFATIGKRNNYVLKGFTACSMQISH